MGKRSKQKKKIDKKLIKESERSVMIWLFVIGIVVIGVIIGIAMRTSLIDEQSKKNEQQQVQNDSNHEHKELEGIIDLNNEELTKVEIETTKGKIGILLQDERMPDTVANFLKLTSNGFYNGLKFHRVEDWVIQGGDPNGDGTGGPGWTIDLETHEELQNVRRAVAMARSIDPDSAGSQFYILKTDTHGLDGGYAVFGHVIYGMDVVDKIEKDDVMNVVKIID